MTVPRLLAPLLLTVAMPAIAADQPSVPSRVDRLEKEVRALQRKVFPGGAPAFSEPEIARAEAPTPAIAPGAAAGQPLNELAARVSALERELTGMTNQLEQDEHRLAILSDAAAKDRAEFDARLKAIETPPAASAAPATAPIGDAGTAPLRPAKAGRGRPPAPLPVPAADRAPADAAPAATTRPAPAATTGDAAEDAYMAGYQLWADKRYDEAAAALRKTAKDYPKSKRASYARNLAGRAELDGGKPATAAQTFLDNYQTDPKGERAPESLFYLGQALTQLKKTDSACRAYDELDSVYGKTLSPTLKGRLPAARKAAACKVAG